MEYASSAAPAAIARRTDITRGVARLESAAPPVALTAARLTAFSILGMSIYAVRVPLGVYVPAIFAQYYGLPLSLLGLIFLVSADYHQRTRVAMYQTVTGSIALLRVLILPTTTDQLYPHDGAPELGAMGGLILALLVPGLILTLRAFPEPRMPEHPPGPVAPLRALPLVAWVGFDPHAAHNSAGALRGVLLTFALGPAIAHVLSALCLSGFALDAAAHADVRRRLAERDVAETPDLTTTLVPRRSAAADR